MKLYERNCPECNGLINYSRKYEYNKALIKNSLCYVCCKKQYGKYTIQKNKNYKKNCPECKNEIYYSTKRSMDESVKLNRLCRPCCDKKRKNVKRDISVINKIKTTKNKNKYVYTNEDKLKMRLSRINYLKQCYGNQLSPCYNKHACQFFENINKINNWNGKHAQNEGEFYIKGLGYWVDFYEPTLNLVLEWDEKSHYKNDILNERDVKRQKNIMDFLKCKFFRIKEWEIDDDLVEKIKTYVNTD